MLCRLTIELLIQYSVYFHYQEKCNIDFYFIDISYIDIHRLNG